MVTFLSKIEKKKSKHLAMTAANTLSYVEFYAEFESESRLKISCKIKKLFIFLTWKYMVTFLSKFLKLKKKCV